MSGPFKHITSEIMYAAADRMHPTVSDDKFICPQIQQIFKAMNQPDHSEEFQDLLQAEGWTYEHGIGTVLSFNDYLHVLTWERYGEFQQEVRFMLCEFIALWLEDEELEEWGAKEYPVGTGEPHWASDLPPGDVLGIFSNF